MHEFEIFNIKDSISSFSCFSFWRLSFRILFIMAASSGNSLSSWFLMASSSSSLELMRFIWLFPLVKWDLISTSLASLLVKVMSSRNLSRFIRNMGNRLRFIPCLHYKEQRNHNVPAVSWLTWLKALVLMKELKLSSYFTRVTICNSLSLVSWSSKRPIYRHNNLSIFNIKY